MINYIQIINAFYPQNTVGKIKEKVLCPHCPWHPLPTLSCRLCHDGWPSPFVSLLVSSLHTSKKKRELGSGVGVVLLSPSQGGQLSSHSDHQEPVLADLGAQCRGFCTASLSFPHLGAWNPLPPWNLTASEKLHR